MRKYLSVISSFIEKIGKQNFILMILIVLILGVTGLYQTFSLYTESGGLSILDGIKTFKFILNSENTENSVTIAAGASKNIAITVSNDDEIDLKYGIYYRSSDDLTNVDLGYKHDTEHLPNGVINSGEDYIVTIQVENNSSNDVKLIFGTIYGLKTGGELILENNQHWLDLKYNYPLNEVKEGSYVHYIGNNGCSGTSCSGQNANYVSDTDMGYCEDSTYKYNYNGWRVGYINGLSAYLISAGAPECMCTNSDGTTSNSSCSTYESMDSNVVYHVNNLNNKGLTYCNRAFTSGNVCSTSSSWNFNSSDFNIITSSPISNCLNFPENTSCGYQNPLVDIGSYYWIANSFLHTDSNYYTYMLYPYHSNYGYFFVGGMPTISSNGVRPIIKIDSSVIVTGGNGTYVDPYLIDNPNTIKDLSGNMNHGVNDGGTWDKSTGTLTLNSDDGVTGNSVNAGLVKHDLGDSASFVIRVKFHEIFEGQENNLIGNWEIAGGGLLLSTNGYITYGFYQESDSMYHYFISTTVPELDTWYTIVGVYDGVNLKIYLNGETLTLNSLSTNAVCTNVMSGNIVNHPALKYGACFIDFKCTKDQINL